MGAPTVNADVDVLCTERFRIAEARESFWSMGINPYVSHLMQS